MKKLNLYEIDCQLIQWPGGRKQIEDHVLYIGAQSLRPAFFKAQRRLNESPHGIRPQFWRLTGKYKLIGKVFV